MSDRDLTCVPEPRKLCDYICMLDDDHVERGEGHQFCYENPSPRTGQFGYPAAPVEPPVLSRAAETLVKTKAMVEERLRGAKEREAQESTRLVNGNLDIRALEAVLESLSHRKGN